MVIELFGGLVIHVTEVEGRAIDALFGMPKAQRPEWVRFPDGSKTRTEKIEGIWPIEQWDRMRHEKAGDWECGFEQWHHRGEQCGHRPEAEPLVDFSDYRRGMLPSGAEPSETARRWLALIAVNSRLMGQTGKFGTLRTLDELDRFEAVGEMPPEVGQEVKGKRVMRRVMSAFPVEGELPVWREVEVFG